MEESPKGWVTQAIFQVWFCHHFIPEVGKYCLEKDIPFNSLLPKVVMTDPQITNSPAPWDLWNQLAETELYEGGLLENSLRN